MKKRGTRYERFVDNYKKPSLAIDTEDGRICIKKLVCGGKPLPLDKFPLQKGIRLSTCKACKAGIAKQRREEQKPKEGYFQY